MQFQKKTFAQLSAKDLAEFDLILGADICFWDELAMDIYRLIKRAKKKSRHVHYCHLPPSFQCHG